MKKTILLLAVVVLGMTAAERGERAAALAGVDFERDIRPLLLARCAGCHGAEKPKAGLRLDIPGGAGAGVIVPGDASRSELMRRVLSEDPAERMPPVGERLTARETGLLREWIESGAAWPRPAATTSEAKRADKATWWSLQPIASPEPPTLKGVPRGWADSPIDRFVFAGLAARGLTPSPPADRRTLIRRLSYDLLGLPPTPEEVESFVADRDPRAWEKLVDRMLASPHYGEQWGRHWLDVARFGESKGFEQNHIINNLWQYRDYVIRSFNDDKPFNRFIVEQLAGDIIGRGDPAIEVATAFLVCGPYDSVGNQDEVQQKVIRANTLDDLVAATSNAFLGLTVNCARCHHHKFDPIPTEDYYRMRAAFEGVTHAERVVATDSEKTAHQAKLQPLEARRADLTSRVMAMEKEIAARALERAGKQPAYALTKVTRHFNEHRFAPVTTGYLRFAILATSDRPKSGENARLDEFEVWTVGESPRNIALATNGTKATGATQRRAEDVTGADTYGVELVIDGRFGERWFVGSPAQLTLAFPRPETIDRIVFSQDRTAAPDAPAAHLGAYVSEYEILVSTDGKEWRSIADSRQRPPLNEAQAVARHAAEVTSGEEAQQLQSLREELDALGREIKSIPPLPTVWAGKFAQPTVTTYVHRGGDPQRRGGDVKPSSLAVLDGTMEPFELATDAPEGERRRSLAEWIASDRNPLTARVIANRVWHYHFGTGIVDTPSDFGFLGGRPSHPELLDWLAHRLRQHGWRLKPLHREILLSQAYRQSSDHREEAARVDAGARLLWRFPPRRLAAEEIRDSMLAVSGSLDRRMGGPGFRLYRYLEDNVATYVPLDRVGSETWRRAVYHQNARASLVDGLTDFDLPDNASAAPARIGTTSPLQALTQLNHQLTLDIATALGERIAREAGPDDEARVRRAFARVFQRRPSPEEEADARQFISKYGWRAYSRALLNASEFLFVR